MFQCYAGVQTQSKVSFCILYITRIAYFRPEVGNNGNTRFKFCIYQLIRWISKSVHSKRMKITSLLAQIKMQTPRYEDCLCWILTSNLLNINIQCAQSICPTHSALTSSASDLYIQRVGNEDPCLNSVYYAIRTYIYTLFYAVKLFLGLICRSTC